jgi:hypothetical protein
MTARTAEIEHAHDERHPTPAIRDLASSRSSSLVPASIAPELFSETGDLPLQHDQPLMSAVERGANPTRDDFDAFAIIRNALTHPHHPEALVHRNAWLSTGPVDESPRYDSVGIRRTAMRPTVSRGVAGFTGAPPRPERANRSIRRIRPLGSRW